MPTITTNQLSFSLPDGTLLLDDIDISLGSGRYGLVGRNGAGKSTLLRLIAGELQPRKGSICCDGEIAYLPQKVYAEVDSPGSEPDVGTHARPRTRSGEVPIRPGSAAQDGSAVGVGGATTGNGYCVQSNFLPFVAHSGCIATHKNSSLDVADLLGIKPALQAISRIEAGGIDPNDFDLVGTDWDVEGRAVAVLERMGLKIALSQTVASLSGGEATILSISALLLRNPQILILDEPTNNLDRHTRARLRQIVAEYNGVLLVVSHDRELLDAMDQIGQLEAGKLRWFSGGFTAYQDAIAAERELAEKKVTQANAEVRQRQRALQQSITAQARRDKQGRSQAGSMPKILANQRKSNAQASAGKSRNIHSERVADAQDVLAQAKSAIPEASQVRIELPETAVPASKQILELRDLECPYADFVISKQIVGSERIALLGRNGIGKTSLFRVIVGESMPVSGSCKVWVPFGYLPQQLNVLRDDISVFANVSRFAPTSLPHDIRAQLARLDFRGATVDQLAGTLSGGERWRATLACLLLAQPAPQLLLLDEPTNNLDLESVEYLVNALRIYQGALMVVSHDETFLNEIDLDERVELASP